MVLVIWSLRNKFSQIIWCVHSLIVFRFGLGCWLCGVGHRVKIAPTIWCNFPPIFLSVLFMAWRVFPCIILEFNDICYSHGWCKLIHLWTVHRFISVVPTFQSDTDTTLTHRLHSIKSIFSNYYQCLRVAVCSVNVYVS